MSHKNSSLALDDLSVQQDLVSSDFEPELNLFVKSKYIEPRTSFLQESAADHNVVYFEGKITVSF